MDSSEILTYSVTEVAAKLQISRALAFRAVATGDLPSVKVGKRLLIPKVALQRLMDGAGKPVTTS